MGMGIAGIPRNLWEIHGDGSYCCRVPMGLEKILWGSCRDGRKYGMCLYFIFVEHLQQQKFVFKLFKDVCSEFTDKIVLLSLN